MQEDLLCIKIKDGLYIGNRRPAEDAQFLITNKFGYILNCTAELGNHFENIQSIHYLKLKYERVKPHKLWGDTYKKLLRFYRFIEEADEQAECCLVHSNLGNNRCCAVVIAYLMKRFLWTFDKTLNYVKSKKVEMKLSPNYIAQLREFEMHLQQQQPLSNDWRRPYLSQQERVIANTYMNTIEIKYEQLEKHPQGREPKRVVWRDRMEKLLANKAKQQAKKLQQQRQQQKQQKEPSKELKAKNSKPFEVEPTVPRKASKKKNEALPKNIAVQKPSEKKKPQSAKERPPLKDDDSIFKLIKKKLRESRQGIVEETEEVSSERTAEEVLSNQVTPVYNLTVNNFINPSISIFTKEKPTKQEAGMVMRPASGDRRVKRQLAQPEEESETKISRTFSQKEHRSLHRDNKQKATNISATLMKSLISLQNDIRRQEKLKGGQASQKASQYKSANIEPLLTRLESPKEPKKMEKSMSFECRKK